MAAATARGTSDACIFVLHSARYASGDLEACNLRTIPNRPIETRGGADATKSRETTGEGRGHEGLHGTDTPSTADGLQPASGAGARGKFKRLISPGEL